MPPALLEVRALTIVTIAQYDVDVSGDTFTLFTNVLLMSSTHQISYQQSEELDNPFPVARVERDNAPMYKMQPPLL